MTCKKKGRCIIIAAGDYFGIDFDILEDDFLIAADGGYEYLKKDGIRPDFLIGDMDSLENGEYVLEKNDLRTHINIYNKNISGDYMENAKDFSIDGIPAAGLSTVKNDSDMMAAVRYGMKKGYKEFHIFGGSGRRADHYIANIQILKYMAEHSLKAYMYTQTQIMTAFYNSQISFSEEYKGIISVFSLSDKSTGVYEKGLKYILKDAVLENSVPLGLSNEFIGEKAEISVENGTVLAIYDRNKKNHTLKVL